MSVNIRCPNCGTTRAALGECEACGEPKVRYFCTNHRPGIWLDSPICPSCGERFGERARPIPTPAPPIPARAGPPKPSRSPAPVRSAARTPALVSTKTSPSEAELEPEAAELAPWQKILAAAWRARQLATSAGAERETRLAVPSAGGCLRRLLLVIVLSLIAFMIAAFFFGRALVHGLQSY
jgi:hypothetical protein